ncbi:hypothetical protein BDV96DRAFT_517743 [Lophiotrema nucula]|uniref:Galactose oxidase n=1 Tax=Lophiotrema nucula TaxID=690887 RepID=A0A6A5ZEL7_9PLEO|nr:hypothetical protein BDV96DRAFT_517743 [Lophiotrema nucula]
MAEIAVGAGAVIAAEQVVSTTVEAGIVGYMVTKPTLPLKATFTKFADAKDDGTTRSLARANHSLTVVGNKAYIFGGTTDAGDATNDIHIVTLGEEVQPESDYHLVPALPNEDGGPVPVARDAHAACSYEKRVAIYGGFCQGEAIDESCCIWTFDTEKLTWAKLQAANADSTPGPRAFSKMFAHDDFIFLYGGTDSSSSPLKDLWRFDINAETWTRLPDAPCAATNAAVANGVLYLISSKEHLSSELHHFDLSAQATDLTWQTLVFPTNPMAPGPQGRNHAGLLPIMTGYGRNYLVYFLGQKQEDDSDTKKGEQEKPTQWSDMWSLQLPSSAPTTSTTSTIKEALKPANIKDKIRSVVGAETHEYSWAEMELKVPDDLGTTEGKLHPGPRSWFGNDVMSDGKSIVFWGGWQDGESERVGDGWMIRFEVA